MRFVGYWLLSGFLAFLSSCGGGGSTGGGTTPAAPVASTSTFQLQVANATMFRQSSTVPFTISGTYNNVSVTGSGTVTNGNATSTIFEGRTTLQKVVSVSGSFTANGTTVPLTTSSTTYVNTNYLPTGESGTEYAVVQGTANIPATALVNDTGNVYTATRYSSSAKSTVLGTVAISFALVPDTPTTALLRITSITKDNTNTITATETTVSRITPAGDVENISDSITYPNGSNLTLTYAATSATQAMPASPAVILQGIDTTYNNLTAIFTWISNVETFAAFTVRAQTELTAQTTYAVDSGSNGSFPYSSTYDPTTQTATISLLNLGALTTGQPVVVTNWITTSFWGINAINSTALTNLAFPVPQSIANAIVNLGDARFYIEFKLDPTTPITGTMPSVILPINNSTTYSGPTRLDSAGHNVTARVTKVVLYSKSTGQLLGTNVLP